MSSTSTIRGVSDINKELGGPNNPQANRTAINWDNYNYPPFLKIMHFDLNELDPSCKTVMRWVDTAYKLLIFCLLTNFVTNFILVVEGVPQKSLHVVYSLFNLVIFTGAGLYLQHCAYKGVAASNSPMMRRYILGMSLLVMLGLAFSLLAFVNWNGWLRLPEAKASGVLHGYWYYATLTEASLFTLFALVGLVAVYHVLEFDRNGPLAFSAKASARGKEREKAKPAASARSTGGRGGGKGVMLSRV